MPATSDQFFMRPLPPESSSTDIHNLICWLRMGTRNQFSRFIDLLKTTAEEAGEAHEELAVALQERFEHYKGVGT